MYMPEPEAELVLRTFNATAADYPRELCIHELVAAQAARTPDAVAVEWRGDRMSYAELLGCAERVGAWLVAHGVAPDGVVALQLSRSLEQVVGVLGVLHSGGAYLPLDPAWPLDRRRFMMEDAACGWLVGQGVHVAEHASWFCGAALVLDDVRRVEEATVACPAEVHRAEPHHLAYVMYTSGSTGKPKGVMVPHAGCVNILHAARCHYGADASARFGMMTSYVFDISFYNIFCTLAVFGGSCLLLESE